MSLLYKSNKRNSRNKRITDRIVHGLLDVVNVELVAEDPPRGWVIQPDGTTPSGKRELPTTPGKSRTSQSAANDASNAASAGAAIVFYPYYPKILDQTDSASEAFGAFLTLCVILRVSVPLLHCCFLQHSDPFQDKRCQKPC